MKIYFYKGDLPSSFKATNIGALDCETMGLNPKRDKLCLVQISNGDEICHLVKIDLTTEKPLNLIKILKNNKIQKIFHYARFDVAVFKHNFKINIRNMIKKFFVRINPRTSKFVNIFPFNLGINYFINS